MHHNSELLFSKFIGPLIGESTRVLEVGPDEHPSTYQRLAAATETWDTADLAGVNTASTYSMASEYVLPVPDGAYDVVLAGQVIEHVRRVWRWVPELARVLRPGGHLALVSPVSWPYHEAPIDCWRIYPEGMRTLCEDAGLEVLVCEMMSLEPAPTRRPYWGVSNERPPRFLKRVLGWPTPRALDVVTVARRPR
jgi:SAM-dependent methyltransferase